MPAVLLSFQPSGTPADGIFRILALVWNVGDREGIDLGLSAAPALLREAFRGAQAGRGRRKIGRVRERLLHQLGELQDRHSDATSRLPAIRNAAPANACRRCEVARGARFEAAAQESGMDAQALVSSTAASSAAQRGRAVRFAFIVFKPCIG